MQGVKFGQGYKRFWRHTCDDRGRDEHGLIFGLDVIDAAVYIFDIG